MLKLLYIFIIWKIYINKSNCIYSPFLIMFSFLLIIFVLIMILAYQFGYSHFLFLYKAFHSYFFHFYSNISLSNSFNASSRIDVAFCLSCFTKAFCSLM